MIIVAIVNLMNNSSVSTMKILLDVGSAVSSFAWLLLTLWAVQSLSARRGSNVDDDATTFGGGRIVSYSMVYLIQL